MITGIILTVLTGALWMLVGVIYSKAADKLKNYAAFMLVYALTFATFVFTVRTPPMLPVKALLPIALTMVPAALLGLAGFWALYVAMQKSSHAVAWTFVQSAMVVPFLGGWLFLGNQASWINLSGAGTMVLALVLLGKGKNSNDDAKKQALSGMLWSIAALLLTGASQFLTLIPGVWYADQTDLLAWRLPLLTLSGVAVWLAVWLVRREKVDKLALFRGVSYGVVVALGQIMLYLALDALQKFNLANAVYPAAITMCIVLFAIYCRIFRHEKFNFLTISGAILMLGGSLLLFI